MATRGGLNRFDPATGRFIAHRHDRADPSSIGGDHVTALLRDSAGALWVGVAGAGLYRYDEARGQFAGTDSASPCFVTIQPTPVAGAPPFPFELRYHQAAIDERLDYIIDANLQLPDGQSFSVPMPVPAIVDGAPQEPIAIELGRVVVVAPTPIPTDATF